mgnify:CR=1 FL=1
MQARFAEETEAVMKALPQGVDAAAERGQCDRLAHPGGLDRGRDASGGGAVDADVGARREADFVDRTRVERLRHLVEAAHIAGVILAFSTTGPDSKTTTLGSGSRRTFGCRRC